MTRPAVDVVVPAAHPALAGHFAGRPIVPAAWLLTLVAAACRDGFGGADLRSLTRARFRAPLAPGATLSIELQRRDDGSVEFRCTSGGTRIADGTLAP
jgi:3-hydroxymyristoyl/3-hydroxydecanoyl-(acyl carrier protein) dehydratase